MAAKGGGAWKVAYADFVTAMMAFFLVMWICGQDQQIRRAVSYYFNDPFNTSKIGNSKKPSRTGSVTELSETGSVPKSESVASGQGRSSHKHHSEGASATKVVSDWVHTDPAVSQYWVEQAKRQRQLAAWSKGGNDRSEPVERIAVQQLAKQLKEEFTRSISSQASGVHQDLLVEATTWVSWYEIAEDLLAK